MKKYNEANIKSLRDFIRNIQRSKTEVFLAINEFLKSKRGYGFTEDELDELKEMMEVVVSTKELTELGEKIEKVKEICNLVTKLLRFPDLVKDGDKITELIEPLIRVGIVKVIKVGPYTVLKNYFEEGKLKELTKEDIDYIINNTQEIMRILNEAKISLTDLLKVIQKVFKISTPRRAEYELILIDGSRVSIKATQLFSNPKKLASYISSITDLNIVATLIDMQVFRTKIIAMARDFIEDNCVEFLKALVDTIKECERADRISHILDDPTGIIYVHDRQIGFAQVLVRKVISTLFFNPKVQEQWREFFRKLKLNFDTKRIEGYTIITMERSGFEDVVKNVIKVNLDLESLRNYDSQRPRRTEKLIEQLERGEIWELG